MYCRNCGKEVSDKAIACPNCGVPPLAGTQFCSNCAAPTQPAQVMCTKCGTALTSRGGAGTGGKSKVAAGLLGIFLGGLGIHKFYLGYNKAGVIMLIASIGLTIVTFGLLSWAVALVGVIEGIIYLTKSDAEFQATYVAGNKEWF